jgi:hypothetical protein
MRGDPWIGGGDAHSVRIGKIVLAPAGQAAALRASSYRDTSQSPVCTAAASR